MLPPGLREILTGRVELTADEIADLTGERGFVVCIAKANDMSAPFWASRGLPAQQEGTCDLCGTAINYRPWSAIARRKICFDCWDVMDAQRERDAS
jgi:hypothetical protein